MVTAFEIAEIMRHQLCGLEDAGEDAGKVGADPGLPKKSGADLDDATLGRIEEHRLRALEIREQRKARQSISTTIGGSIAMVGPSDEDEDVFGFGCGVDDECDLQDDARPSAVDVQLPNSGTDPARASGEASSLPPLDFQPEVRSLRGVGDSVPTAQAGAGSSSQARA